MSDYFFCHLKILAIFNRDVVTAREFLVRLFEYMFLQIFLNGFVFTWTQYLKLVILLKTPFQLNFASAIYQLFIQHFISKKCVFQVTVFYISFALRHNANIMHYAKSFKNLLNKNYFFNIFIVEQIIFVLQRFKIKLQNWNFFLISLLF